MPPRLNLPKYVHRVHAKGRTYYYFRNGKTRFQILGEPGSAEFHASYAAVLAKQSVNPKRVPAKDGTLAWLIEQYRHSSEFRGLSPKTKQSYERELQRLAMFAQFQAVDIRRKHLNAIRGTLDGHPRTQQLFGQVCSLLWNYGIRELDLDTLNPAQKMRRAGKSESYVPWTGTEMELFETGPAPVHVRTAYMIARYTGPRRWDVVHLMRSDYNGTTLKIAGTKSDTPTEVPVHPRLKAYLDALPPSLYLVTDERGRPVRPDRITKDMRTYLDSLGMTHLHLHGLRHTAGHVLAEAGCSSHEIAAVLGHNTLQMVERYTKRAERGRLAAAAIIKLERGKG